MILLIDNYDSFTYNLAQHLGQLGETLLVRRNDQIALDEIARLKPERIVISPGPGVPEDAGITVALVRRSARTPDGTIMGLRHRKLRVEGVQFHPESVLTDVGIQILRNFLAI